MASKLGEVRAARIAVAQRKKRVEEAARSKFKKNEVDVGKNARVNVFHLGLYVFKAVPGKNSSIVNSLMNVFRSANKDTMKKSTKMDNLTYSLIEIVARNTRLQRLFAVTREYGKKGTNMTTAPTSIDFKIKVADKDSHNFGIISVFPKSGIVLIKSGYMGCKSPGYVGFSSQPQRLFESLLIMNNKTINAMALTRINTVGSMRLGRKFNEKEFLRTTFRMNKIMGFNVLKKKSKKQNQRVTKTYLQVPGQDHIISITKQGVVQVAFKGKITKDDLTNTSTMIKQFNTTFKDYFGGKINKGSPVKKKSMVGSNQPAPNVARRGTTCPIGRRPVPQDDWNGKCPDGMYCRPNPQQQPCCYKIPVNKKGMSLKIKQLYDQIGVKVPNGVANIFGINKNARPSASPQMQIFKTMRRDRKPNGTMVNVVNIRIGTRQCFRYTKQQLVHFIEKMGHDVTGLSKKTKPQLCEYIAKLYKNTSANKMNTRYIPTVRMNGQNYTLTLKQPGNKLVVGKRECSSLPKKTMQKICAALGIRFNESTTRLEMCGLINTKRKNMQNNRNKNKNNNAAKLAANRMMMGAKLNAQRLERRDKKLYGLFLKQMRPFLNKNPDLVSRVPNKNTLIKTFENAVNRNEARAVTDVGKQKWGRRGYELWAARQAIKLESKLLKK